MTYYVNSSEKTNLLPCGMVHIIAFKKVLNLTFLFKNFAAKSIFMSIVMPDGQVIEHLDPCPSDGKHNDTTHTRHIIDTNKKLTN